MTYWTIAECDGVEVQVRVPDLHKLLLTYPQPDGSEVRALVWGSSS